MNKNNVLTSLGCVNYSKDVNFMSASLEKNIGLLIAKFQKTIQRNYADFMKDTLNYSDFMF